jgi:hypothetical protein
LAGEYEGESIAVDLLPADAVNKDVDDAAIDVPNFPPELGSGWMGEPILFQEIDVGAHDKGFLGAEGILDEAGMKVFYEHFLDAQVVARRPEITDSGLTISESGKPLPKDRSVAVRGIEPIGITDQKALAGEGVALDLVTEVVARVGNRLENSDLEAPEPDG